MKMMVYISLFILLIATSCGSSGSNNSDSENKTATLAWNFTTQYDDMDIPHTTVVLMVDNKQTVVAENALGEFTVMDKSQYASYNIPENTLEACQGGWAGLVSFYIVVSENNKLVVKEGFTDEGIATPEFKNHITIN